MDLIELVVEDRVEVPQPIARQGDLLHDLVPDAPLLHRGNPLSSHWRSFPPDFQGKFRLESIAVDKMCARIVWKDRFPKLPMAAEWVSRHVQINFGGFVP